MIYLQRNMTILSYIKIKGEGAPWKTRADITRSRGRENTERGDAGYFISGVDINGVTVIVAQYFDSAVPLVAQ